VSPRVLSAAVSAPSSSGKTLCDRPAGTPPLCIAPACPGAVGLSDRMVSVDQVTPASAVSVAGSPDLAPACHHERTRLPRTPPPAGRREVGHRGRRDRAESDGTPMAKSATSSSSPSPKLASSSMRACTTSSARAGARSVTNCCSFPARRGRRRLEGLTKLVRFATQGSPTGPHRDVADFAGAVRCGCDAAPRPGPACGGNLTCLVLY